ncbi:MAG TPA: hypothetical protein DCS07_07535 [Bdellovibrionales bacterium]|nr:MAG: hypothetical protein A2X97_03075 [Bdellovibrionales bacterium GWA1_52_35]HAR42470.1 hypothetical protein [Bdellovibrionales bacterium]HCM40175.1 hypothetical protein [Bdellovibrionales bacterium]
MLSPIFLGLIAAAAVAIPIQLGVFIEAHFHSLLLSAPVFLLAATGIAMLMQRFVLDRTRGSRGFDGLPDIFIHIHSSANPDSALRWVARGLNSFLLTFFGGTVGPEGAAVEFAHATAIQMRAKASGRFEQRRRTDASVALAAGISAAFGAPFAGILVPIELGIGGPLRPAVVASLTAFAGVRLISTVFSSSGFLNFEGALNSFHFGWREAIGILVVALLSSLMAALLTYLIRYLQENFRDLFRVQVWMRTLTAGALLFFVAMIYKSGHMMPNLLVEKILWGRLPSSEFAILLLTQALSLGFVLAGFGTIGIFWPLFVIGSTAGAGVGHWVLNDIPGFAAAAGLTGAAAMWGGVLGTPLAAAIVVWELTGSVQGLAIAGFSALLSSFVVKFLKTPALVEKTLESRGVTLVDGRSGIILESILVRDAMVSDFETVHEHEPVSEIHSRLIRSKYPFLPVVTSGGIYKGLLTIDMIQDAWDAQEIAALKKNNSPLIKFLEAKDLLYRAGSAVAPTIRVSEKLSHTAGLFDESPCIPVLTDDNRVVGLLFVYNVRLAYDREVARRSLVENRKSDR